MVPGKMVRLKKSSEKWSLKKRSPRDKIPGKMVPGWSKIDKYRISDTEASQFRNRVSRRRTADSDPVGLRSTGTTNRCRSWPVTGAETQESPSKHKYQESRKKLEKILGDAPRCWSRPVRIIAVEEENVDLYLWSACTSLLPTHIYYWLYDSNLRCFKRFFVNFLRLHECIKRNVRRCIDLSSLWSLPLPQLFSVSLHKSLLVCNIIVSTLFREILSSMNN